MIQRSFLRQIQEQSTKQVKKDKWKNVKLQL